MGFSICRDGGYLADIRTSKPLLSGLLGEWDVRYYLSKPTTHIAKRKQPSIGITRPVIVSMGGRVVVCRHGVYKYLQS